MVYKPTYNWGDPSREVRVVLFFGTLGLQIEVNVQVVGRHQLETPVDTMSAVYTVIHVSIIYANGSGPKTSHYDFLDLCFPKYVETLVLAIQNWFFKMLNLWNLQDPP